MTEEVEYGVAAQEDEFADEYITGCTTDRVAALDALKRAPFARAYLVLRTANGWVEAR
ncbi:hypothetical protein AB0N77_20385 [Streptomyces misionensis]|uniref:hypothetical protein n=1 Tax=Streptomyces misionensis TaxID=67331 RepID=UPI0034259A5E